MEISFLLSCTWPIRVPLDYNHPHRLLLLLQVNVADSAFFKSKGMGLLKSWPEMSCKIHSRVQMRKCKPTTLQGNQSNTHDECFWSVKAISAYHQGNFRVVI